MSVVSLSCDQENSFAHRRCTKDSRKQKDINPFKQLRDAKCKWEHHDSPDKQSVPELHAHPFLGGPILPDIIRITRKAGIKVSKGRNDDGRCDTQNGRLVLRCYT